MTLIFYQILQVGHLQQYLYIVVSKINHRLPLLRKYILYLLFKEVEGAEY
jgi:hypothetical protein